MDSEKLLLKMEKIDKRYPGVHALDNVDFDLYEGEVHVLLGENGAGKSTLVKILSGSIQRDSGNLVILDQDINHYDPEQAREMGIGMVYQELSLVPALSVAENIFLGQYPRSKLRVINWHKMIAEAKRSLDELGVKIDPKEEVRKLSVSEQQLTEIARVLTKDPKILLLDEPTSALSDTERARLFEIIHRLRDKGVGIIYISHNLSEVPLVGDRVTVLRDGQHMGPLAVEDVVEDTLVNLMVGRRLKEQYPKAEVEIGEPVLQVNNFTLEGSFNDISIKLRRGEILGLFGLMGSGQEELARSIFGLEKVTSGSIALYGKEIKIRHPSDAIKNGLGLLTRDRREGLVPLMSIPPNITLADLSQKPIYGMLKLKAESDAATNYVDDLRIQTPSVDRAVMFLSGGNQQKVVLARWLFSEARVLIFDEPTRGIDVGAKSEVFSLMNELTSRGVGILMISSEMPEIIGMANRIIVIRRGRISAEFPAGEATQEKLLRSAS
jgi:ribose transport system ATP-binding protein